MNKMDLTDIYRVFHPKATDYIFFFCPWNFLQNKSKPKQIKKLKIITCNLTDHDGIKLEINGQENHKNHSNS
jgi:hypothetical protein